MKSKINSLMNWPLEIKHWIFFFFFCIIWIEKINELTLCWIFQRTPAQTGGGRSSGELNLYESKYGRPWAGMLNNVIIFWFKILGLGGLKEFHFKAQFCCQNSKVKAKSLPSFFFEQQTLITNYIICYVHNKLYNRWSL